MRKVIHAVTSAIITALITISEATAQETKSMSAEELSQRTVQRRAVGGAFTGFKSIELQKEPLPDSEVFRDVPARCWRFEGPSIRQPTLSEQPELRLMA